ncbi:hypothetical protein AAG570_012133 [Ranatra chinensis]|uniref:LIM zinc-binding domain-containing protein n=1 Tax=Ranatra chinensis TaxID=642074 RepID=A0ABD0YI28_9HEMI
MKKTKKSKKSDEKENHISVITNGHDSQESESPSISAVDENELSNVCVKELKLTYVNEAAKSYNVQSKPSEEPVLPTVPIRELRRSFGDIHRACEDSDFIQNNLKEKQMRTRSLGDLRRDEKKAVVTGVNVKELKSSFSKFDQLSKSAVFHVRSSDTSKAQKTFSQGGDAQGTAVCKSCGKTVFVMEQIKAERAVWHKNCFRCKTCNKQLTVDIYSSHEGELYCKPHFKELFKPKAVVDAEEEPVRRRKPEMIIRENQPVELPPDVVRASDKADLGLEELSSLNVKSRFQVFEKHESTDEQDQSLTHVNVKRSPSILCKLARFQKKGMDIGVTDEELNGFKYEETSSEEEDEEEEDVEEEKGVIKCRKIRERPMSFNKLDDVKRTWECGQSARKDELREERKQEIQHIRSRLFMGKQGKMKEMYEQAVAESEGRGSKKEVDTDIVKGEKAKAVREKFEKGETVHSDSDHEKDEKLLDEDMSVFEEGISKKSRSIFLEMDANISKSSSTILPAPKPITREQHKGTKEIHHSRQTSEEVVRASDPVEDVTIETADLSSRFKFFEAYKAPEVRKKAFRITPPREGTVKSDSPEREVYRDPDVVRSDEKLEDDNVVLRSHTASKMLSLFRQMEEQKEVLPDGPKPKKCFTPPPDYKEDRSESSEDESEEGSEGEEEDEEYSDDDTGIVRSSHKIKDEFLEQAHKAARAKELAAKFEQWEPEKHSTNNAINMLETDVPSIDSTKSLRARFESLKTEQPKDKQRPKVNRFVDAPITNCASCQTKVYPLEKTEASGRSFHKACFRCTQCNNILRMDSYTLNNGQLYCMPHFKQLFIAKGNYDEGFGLDQHKRKWESPVNGSS